MLTTIQSRIFFLSLSRLLSRNIEIRIYKNIILSLVLYGRETWSLTLKEEDRLMAFQNWVLRRILGPKRDEVIECSKNLHNEELCKLYSRRSI
jgi:hypothetical protein